MTRAAAAKIKKPKSNVRRLQGLAATRLSPEEFEQLQAIAAADGRSVSDYLRNLVRRELASV